MRTTLIEVNSDVISTLFSWHGGQWSAVYSVASSLNAGNVAVLDKNTVGQAVIELERDYRESKGRKDITRQDRKELKYAIDVLKEVYTSMPDDGSEDVDSVRMYEPIPRLNEYKFTIPYIDEYIILVVKSDTFLGAQNYLARHIYLERQGLNNKLDYNHIMVWMKGPPGPNKLHMREFNLKFKKTKEGSKPIFSKDIEVSDEIVRSRLYEPVPKRMTFDEAWTLDNEFKNIHVRIYEGVYTVWGEKSKYKYFSTKDPAKARKFIHDTEHGRGSLKYGYQDENIGSVPEIRNWSIVEENDPWAAPELKRKMVTGKIYNHRKHEDGQTITTSFIDTVTGRSFTTVTGSIYKLVGKPSPRYAIWMKENGIKYNSKNPIRQVK